MFENLIKDPRQRRIALFILKATGLYLLWFIAYDFFLAPAGKLDEWLNYRVATDASHLLDLFGYNGSTATGTSQTLITIDNIAQVGVGNPCNGLELFALFAGFILCFPGQWKTKLWFIPLGMLLIHLVNAIRAAILALIQMHAPEKLDFNHHYTFTIVVYSVIFGLWMWWANRSTAFSNSGTATA